MEETPVFSKHVFRFVLWVSEFEVEIRNNTGLQKMGV